jgi:hypothetical protein
MRSFKPGAVSIDPLAQRGGRHRARPTAPGIAPAIAIAKNKSGDPAAPAAPAGRSAHCSASSPRDPRLARA